MRPSATVFNDELNEIESDKELTPQTSKEKSAASSSHSANPHILWQKNNVFSQLDLKISINEDRHAVTLIRINYHAEIFVEYVEHEIYKCEIFHLEGTGSSTQIFPKSGSPSDFVFGFMSSGNIVHIPNMKIDNLKYHAKSPTWSVEKSKVNEMRRHIKNQQSKGCILFSILGHNSIINVAKEKIGFKPAFNCCSWAIETLLSAGINLTDNSFNFLTHTSNYTVPDLMNKKIDIAVLCKFAKEGRYYGILTNFNRDFNVNQYSKDACHGIVESTLIIYTPLALAICYGHFKTMRILIQYYNADPFQCVGEKNNLNAFDCAKLQFQGVKNTQKELIVDFLEHYKSLIANSPRNNLQV